MIRRLWRSTFGIVVLVALAFAAATLAIGAVAYEVTHEALEEQLDHRVAVETRALMAEEREAGLAGVAEAIRLREDARNEASLDYLLVDRNGRTIAATIAPLAPPEPGYQEHFGFRRGDSTGVGQALATPLAGGLLVVVADRRDLAAIDRTLALLFAGALGAVLALGIGAAVLVGWLTRRRLSRVDATAKAIIAGDLTQRVPRDGSGSEFDRLAATLNRMLDRMAALMDNLRQVSTDVAHDLRTPLTRLCNQLDRAAAGDAEAIDAARRQANDLLEIFAALLRIAEVEGLAERRALAVIELSALLDDMAETYRPDFEAAGHHLATDIPPGLHLEGDRRLLAQALSNLLENTLRHTPAGTTATLSARTTHDAIEVTLKDDGPGVSPADAERLFQRFARAETSRTTDGHGLGLALVRAIAVGHGGNAFLSESGGGFGVTIRLKAGRQG
ncbi:MULTISPECIES: sensor histidine kinase [Sphingomonas]|uniref:sensor histidine kinase n=1 Tax=Sphingomonas TaxID=13687 RepID=UPI001E18966E|nr:MULTISPECIES: HAMP domain-containing sensor histidine kinase [Sphingomonas]MBY0300366.1 HAMP domain-containing histidine kinase [Sphingomonas ginsenosidimutans]UYY79697.1 HAMP domain-containing histidine kinase [Sphingomonas sp. R1]